MSEKDEGATTEPIDLEPQFAALQASQDRICAIFFAIANHQDWQPHPDEWSFRYIAAHMAQVELDCHLRRVLEISAGEKPHYSYYLNTGWDFSSYDIQDSISTWRERRNEVVMTLRRLDSIQLNLKATHEHFGEIKAVDVLQLALDHDKEHENHLNEIMKSFDAGEGQYALHGTVTDSS